MELGDLERLEARVEAAGLKLDDARLETAVALVDAIEAMMDAVRTIPVDPVDLAMSPYDPAWPEEQGR